MMRAILLVTTALATSPALAAEIEADSAIARVTVYPDGASVERKVAVAIPAGETVVVLRGLPAGLDARSLRVTGDGDAVLSIASVDSRVVPGDARPAADADLERRLEALRAERDAAADAIAAADGQKAAILRYAQASPEKLGADGKPLDVEKWPDAWRTIGQGLTEINDTLRAQKNRVRTLADEIAALERARPQPQRPGAPKTDVLIAVTGAEPVRANLSVAYRVGSASWTPVYDARLLTTGDRPKLELVRRAAVQQRTGEDWKGVALSLSTVRSRRDTAAPDLATQTLGIVDPQAEAEAARAASVASAGTLQRPMPAAKSLAENRAADAVAPPPVPAAPVLATLDAGAYAASFGVPGAIDLPQDGTVRTFTLATKTVDPVLGARAVPALDPTAYLEASFTNEEDAPLLPGEVALQRDGAYVGKGRFALVAPGDRLRLGFGADESIRISRNPVVRKDSETYWGASRGETQDFRTTVRNLHSFPVRITLIDRIPVSEHTAISVTPLDTNTPPTEKTIEDRRGVMGWTYDYKAGEQKDVRLGWRVRWPADRELRRQ